MAAASSVAWPPMFAQLGKHTLCIRQATPDDIPYFLRWDLDPAVIACASDDPDADEAFGAEWAEEIAGNSDGTCYYIAELDGRPVGAMQVIDPHREPTHYWGDIAPNIRAIDIWIGDAGDRNKGIGAAMMRAAIDACFADPAVSAIVIDPLASNTNAHRFYQRLGFTPVGRRMFGDDDCLVHQLMRDGWRARCADDHPA